jgi:hypothetical protein
MKQITETAIKAIDPAVIPIPIFAAVLSDLGVE